MENPEYCPQCVVELEKDNMKLGEFSSWLKCPICGYRTRPSRINTDKVGRVLDAYRVKNKNLNKFNTYTEDDI